MKNQFLRIVSAFLVSLMFVNVNAQEVVEQTFYLDFGKNDGTNGHETLGADSNGNYWTNISNSAWDGPIIDLINSENTTTAITLDMLTTFGANGILHGGLTNPDPALLGDLAISTATEDYFFLSGSASGSIKFSNLNPDREYKFTFFGCRGYVSDRITKYKLVGSNTVEGELATQIGTAMNDRNVFESTSVLPNGSNEIYLDINSSNSTFAYVNIIKIEEISCVGCVDVTDLAISANNMTGLQAPQQISSTITPSNATTQSISWSVDDESIAKIDANGVLYPKKNGSVVVTASITDRSGTYTDNATVVISGQSRELYLFGTAHDATSDQLFYYQDLSDGELSGIYYAYVPLLASGDFILKYTDENSQVVSYGLDVNDNLVKDGNPISVPNDGPYSIRANFNDNTIEIIDVTNWKLVGTQVAGSWSGGDGLELAYQGGSVWKSQVTFARDASETYDAMLFRMNDRGDKLLSQLSSDYSKLSFKTDEALFGSIKNFSLPDGDYIVTLDLSNYTYKFEAPSIDDKTIVFCGSSVAYGWGATNNQGYAFMYNQLLDDRATNNLGETWNVKNVSIGGDTTVKVEARYDRDVTSAGAKYLVIGLSLANEGIMSGGQAIFDQFKTNMLGLIDRARNDGYTPVVVGNYANGLYDATDYDFVKQMNLLIHQWDVPSINVLGAIDDGNGKFIDGENGLGDYMSDTAHPNDDGHEEFYHAFVPSMFDALHAGKALPSKVNNTFVEVQNNGTSSRNFEYTTEGVVHPFTVSIDIKSSDFEGDIISLTGASATAKLSYDNTNSKLIYTDFAGTTHDIAVDVNDGNWNKITLSHYWAREKTIVYFNKNEELTVAEQPVISKVKLNNETNTGTVSLREFYFYRSGMNVDEISAMVDGDFLKSSLELYAPLDGQAVAGNNVAVNLALSTSLLSDSQGNNLSKEAVNFKSLKVYPNPSSEFIVVDKPEIKSNVNIAIYNISGQEVFNNNFSSSEQIKINVSSFQKGIYFVKLSDSNYGNYSSKIIVE